MKAMTALFKKEWHTAKWFLLGGILFFWSFPLIDGVAAYLDSGKFETTLSSEMSWMFGGVFAILTACGLVCLDMSRRLHEFWRSRPVRLLPCIIVKYVVGLAVMLFVITIPLLVEDFLFQNSSYSRSSCDLCYHGFVILLLYSTAFCAGHLFRNMTEATIISFAAALLVYFIPVLVPALERLSFFNLATDYPPGMEIITKLSPDASPKSPSYPQTNWGHKSLGYRQMYWMPVSSKSLLVIYIFREFWLFAGTMTALSILMIIGAWICLRYHLQIRLGLKSLCWTLGLVALILFSAAAFSVASNLKCLAKIPLGIESKIPVAFSFDGGDGLVLYKNTDSQGHVATQIGRFCQQPSYAYKQEFYAVENMPFIFLRYRNGILWSRQTPDIVYFFGTTESGVAEGTLRNMNLYAFKLDESTHTARQLSELSLGQYDESRVGSRYTCIRPVIEDRTIYLRMSKEVVVVDVHDSQQPFVIAKFEYPNKSSEAEISKGIFYLPLPSDNRLSRQQQYCVMRNFSDDFFSRSWEGQCYAECDYDAVRICETNQISDTKIQPAQIAVRKRLPLERLLFYYYYYDKIILRGDTIYLLHPDIGLTLYHFDKTALTLKNIGHYAAPECKFHDMTIRDDGRIVLIGDKQIHLVQPPH